MDDLLPCLTGIPLLVLLVMICITQMDGNPNHEERYSEGSVPLFCLAWEKRDDDIPW